MAGLRTQEHPEAGREPITVNRSPRGLRPRALTPSLREIRQLILPIVLENPLPPPHPLRHRVVHVPHLVAPRAESAARVNVLRLEPWMQHPQRAVALEARRRVSVVPLDEKGVDDVLPVALAQELRVDHPLDGLLDDGVAVH